MEYKDEEKSQQAQWGQALLLEKRAERLAYLTSLGQAPRQPIGWRMRPPGNQQDLVEDLEVPKSSENGSGEAVGTLKVYPSLVMTTRARKDGTDSAIRIWHIARQMSAVAGGSGTVSVEQTRRKCDRSGWVVSDRHWRRMLNDGDGLLWQQVVSKGQPMLRLVGITRLACALGLTNMDWCPILVPANRLRRLKTWRAACYAAWHGGRSKKTAPISRQVQREILKVPERTQRSYTSEEDGLIADNNFALSEDKLGREALADNILFGRGHTFVWHDGRLARRLPNSYQVSFEHAPSGMCRKVTHTLSVGLLNNLHSSFSTRADSKFGGRLFFDTSKGASRAMRRYSVQSGRGIPAGMVGTPLEVFGRSGQIRSHAGIWEIVS